MGRVAFLFAGQGAQHTGMGQALAEREAAARAVFDAADAVRPGTSEQCFTAPKEVLSDTAVTQPTVFACDLACARALVAHGVEPEAVAGFSLGEVAALTFAGAFTDEQGFRLVGRRAEVMAEAAAEHPGEMRAVVKLDAPTIEKLAQEAGEAWPVNYNSPQQTVVAGTPEAIAKLDGLVKEARGRALKMAVSGAFHSPFMADATNALTEILGDDGVGSPRIPVIANLTGKPYPVGDAAAPERARTLAQQASHPVRWVDTLRGLAEEGFDTFIEVGPGSTLTGLVKRTLTGVTALACETPEQLDQVLETLSGENTEEE